MRDYKWYVAGDGSAGRWDSGDADADRAGDVEYDEEWAYYQSLTDDELDALLEKRRRVRKIAYDKHDAVLVAKAFSNHKH